MCPLEGVSSGDASQLSSSRWNSCFASDSDRTQEQHLPSTPRSLWGGGCHHPRPPDGGSEALGGPHQGAGQAPHQCPAGRREGRPARLSAPHNWELSELGPARVSICRGSAHEYWATSLSGGPGAEVHFPTLCPPGWGHPPGVPEHPQPPAQWCRKLADPLGPLGTFGEASPSPRPGLSWGSCPRAAGINTAFWWLDQGVVWVSTWPQAFPASPCLPQLHVTSPSPF